MAEIVGLIASIVNIIEGINKANGFVRKHLHSNKSIKRELVPVLAKVTAFAGLLQAVKLHVEFEDDQDRLEALTHIDGPLFACKHAASMIETRLDRIVKVGSLSFGKVLDKECLSALNILDQTKPVLELALMADQRTLLTSIETYSQNIAEQLQTLRTDSNDSLQRLEERAASIEAHIIHNESSEQRNANLKQQEQILVWTSSLNHRANLNAARKHTVGVPGTGRWFIDGDQYRHWTGRSPGIHAILLQGIPGAGKTVLASTIIDEIIQTTSATDGLQIAYFFFDFNDLAKQTVEGMLRSLVFQLAMSLESIPKALEELHERHHQYRAPNARPTVEEWIEILVNLLNEKERFYVVVDALDECQEEIFLVHHLRDIVSRSADSTRWLFTSQVSDQFSLSLSCAGVQIVGMEASIVDDDIARYLDATLEIDPRLRSYSSQAKEKIGYEIRIKAQGIWAQCQIEVLRQLQDRRLKTVALVLSRMPEDLNSYYERTLSHLCWLDPSTAISNMDLVYGIVILVAFSGRAVTVTEAAEFAIIEDSPDIIQPSDRFEDPLSILPLVGTLITVQDSILTLAHKSVKDFLESPRAKWGPLQIGRFLGTLNYSDDFNLAADIFIARRCFKYLAVPHTSARRSMMASDVRDPNLTYLAQLKQANPLLDYAARMWPHHLRESDAQREIQDIMDSALQPYLDGHEATLWQGWLFLQRADIWEQQVWLASFLCECFIRSTLVCGWTKNFWQQRHNYRVTNAPAPDHGCQTMTIGGSISSANLATVIRERSEPYFDLYLLLLEIAYQKPLYNTYWEQLQEAKTVESFEFRVEQYKSHNKDILHRVGQGYLEAMSACLQLVKHKNDKTPPYMESIFSMQERIRDTVHRPLCTLASSGFRRSRRMREATYQSTLDESSNYPSSWLNPAPPQSQSLYGVWKISAKSSASLPSRQSVLSQSVYKPFTEPEDTRWSYW